MSNEIETLFDVSACSLDTTLLAYEAMTKYIEQIGDVQNKYSTLSKQEAAAKEILQKVVDLEAAQVKVLDAYVPDYNAKEFIIKSKHSKNYNFALYGFSNYRLVAIGLNEGSVYFNKQARILKELVSNILKEEKEIKR